MKLEETRFMVRSRVQLARRAPCPVNSALVGGVQPGMQSQLRTPPALTTYTVSDPKGHDRTEVTAASAQAAAESVVRTGDYPAECREVEVHVWPAGSDDPCEVFTVKKEDC